MTTTAVTARVQLTERGVLGVIVRIAAGLIGIITTVMIGLYGLSAIDDRPDPSCYSEPDAAVVDPIRLATPLTSWTAPVCRDAVTGEERVVIEVAPDGSGDIRLRLLQP